MEAGILIEPETPADYEAIDRVHRLAFGQEAEAGLVRALREQGYTRPYHSLVARIEGEIVGHVLFSSLPIEHDGGTMDAMSLAPVAVIPSHQRKGIGSKLIRAGLERARADRTPGLWFRAMSTTTRGSAFLLNSRATLIPPIPARISWHWSWCRGPFLL